MPYPSGEDLEREARDVVERAQVLVPPDVSICSVVWWMFDQMYAP